MPRRIAAGDASLGEHCAGETTSGRLRPLVFAALVFGAALPLNAATPKLVTATYLGTAGDDDLQDVAVAKDGTIYVVGNLDRPLNDLPGDVETRKLGSPEESWYRCGFGAVLSPDAGKLLHCLQFARGQVFLTSVALGDGGIYVGGYAVPEFARAIKPFEGLFGDARKANGVPLLNPLPGAPQPPAASLPSRPERDASGRLETLTIKTRHHGDKGGVPIVMRLREDLGGIAAGTSSKAITTPGTSPCPATRRNGHRWAWRPCPAAI